MIRKATVSDCGEMARLASLLWPGKPREDREREFAEVLAREDWSVFLALDGEAPVAFAQCALRRDYVEGTSSSPVGYLEGIYVDEAHRLRGVARALVERCQEWARAKGCAQFASDCELTNEASLAFHLRAGFAEANRVICFVKEL